MKCIVFQCGSIAKTLPDRIQVGPQVMIANLFANNYDNAQPPITLTRSIEHSPLPSVRLSPFCTESTDPGSHPFGSEPAASINGEVACNLAERELFAVAMAMGSGGVVELSRTLQHQELQLSAIVRNLHYALRCLSA